jgi:hypothetical protein
VGIEEGSTTTVVLITGWLGLATGAQAARTIDIATKNANLHFISSSLD